MMVSEAVGRSWWPSFGTPTGPIVTLATIASVRGWAERALGAQSSVLVIEREGERNRVALRFWVKDAIGECAVSELRAIHKRRLSGPALHAALWAACFAMGAGHEASSGRG